MSSSPSSSTLPPTVLLLQEIQTVTSAMRRNQRWASVPASSAYAGSALAPGGARARRRPEGKKRDTEGDLMDGFVELRRAVVGVKDITSLPPQSLADPFLALIRSPLTSGPITSLSLSSLHSLILHILPLYLSAPPRAPPSPATPLQLAVVSVTSALASCRFPSSSAQQDELVLLRLLRVIEALTVAAPVPPSGSPLSAAGRTYASLMDHMNDESVCELLEVGLGMLARGRLSEGLRSAAQSTVQAITRAIFARLGTLRPEDVERVLRERTRARTAKAEGGVEINPAGVKQAEEVNDEAREASPEVEGDRDRTVTPPAGAREVEAAHAVEDRLEVVAPPRKPAAEVATINLNDDPAPASTPPDFVLYGLPTLLELLRVLVALLNPADQAHTDSMRLSALAVLNSALEVGGSGLGAWPELREGVRDEGCRYLFQLTRSDSPALLAQSLRATSTLFSTLLPHLKLQLELFLSYAIDRLTPPTPSPLPAHLLRRDHTVSRPGSPAPGATATADGGIEEAEPLAPATATPRPMSLLPPAPPETRELMLETLTQIALRPSFMVDCWVNYDCSTDSEDIFERLIAFLTRGVYPTGPKADGSTSFEGLDNAQLLCLEILLGFVSAMADRLDEGDEPWPASAPTPADLTLAKSRKAVLLTGAAQFNTKPKTGLAYLEKNGLIVPDTEAAGGTEQERRDHAVARFLRSSARLDKKEMGEFISRPDQLGLLKAFIGTFDFQGKSIADAMRELLETFRLPGEAQPIARITETFAEHFFSFQPPEIASQDAVYVLAYSVIMLNTDLHNPQNRKRMTIDDYKRNLRGVNDGKDFPPEYLAGIHESLKKREIILPEEHVGQPGFDYAWKSLMQRSRTAGPMLLCNTAAFDEPMFRLAWRPLVSAIAYAFTMSSTDEHVIQRAIAGFRQCASLAGRFHLPEVFDTIVQSLSTATGLLDDTDEGYTVSAYPTTEKDGQEITVSPLAIRFGQSYRAQLATVVLFGIANGNGGAIRTSWAQVFEMFQTLFLHNLLPAPMLQMEDFLAGTTTIPLKVASPTPAPERRPEGGLLSTLSSYLLSPYGSSNDNLVVEVSDDDVENTLVAIDCIGSCKLEALYAEILSLDVDALIPALHAIRALAESRTTLRLEPRETADGYARFDGQLPYDPACVLHLEMMVSIAANGKEHIAETWPIIFEYIAALLSSAQSYSVLLIERAVVGLLRLCLLVSEKCELRDQLYIALDVLRSLPSSVLNAVSEQLMAGIARILEKDAAVVKSQTEWGLIIALFRATVAHPEAGKVTLVIVQRMATGGEPGPGLSPDNYAGVVALLDEFATAAGAAAVGRLQVARRNSGGVQPTLGPTVERGLTALDSLFELRNVIPGLMEGSGKAPQDAFNAFWLPPLLVIGKQCVNSYREIRQRAMAYLHRLLLSPQLLSTDESTLPTIFDRVLFPVLDELLKPQTAERDPVGMQETRLKAATLLCKVFLQYVVRLQGGMVGGVFGRVLDKLERLMKGDRDVLNEVGESLKNVVLVMHSSGLLLPPPRPEAAPAQGGQAVPVQVPAPELADTRTQAQKDLWESSSRRIERVLPGFLGEALT
ncbi:GDP/GTP exchange factor for ARF [Cryptotrichosporon argae]